MNKLDFLRPKPFKHRGGVASINHNGLRVNSDGTTILDRKPDLNLKPNHRRFKQTPKRSWVSRFARTAVSDGRGWYVKQTM
jgi:hypothetical protein